MYVLNLILCLLSNPHKYPITIKMNKETGITSLNNTPKVIQIKDRAILCT